jgi:hypothetical protein
MPRLIVLIALLLAVTTAQATTIHVPSEQPAVAATDCCHGLVGNANGSIDEVPTLGDISVMIDMLFISGKEVACLAEADINLSGGCNPTRGDITIGDLSMFINTSFGIKARTTGLWLGWADCPNCPPEDDPGR